MGNFILTILKKLFRKKNLVQETSMDTPLKRCLTTSDLTFYSVSHMAGAGIYVLTGRLIRDVAGPAAAISYLIAALSALFTGICYAEFATLIPKAGSCYTYTYIVLGEFPAFIIGWTMLADMLISMAAVAKGFSGTINLLTGGAISNWTLQNVGKLPESPLLDETIDLIACGFLLILMLIVLGGAKISLRVNSALTTAQVLCLSIVAISCFVWGNAKNWEVDGGFSPFGFSGVMSGSGIAVYAFSGFEALSYASEEAKTPKKSIPIALFSSLGIITILYMMACLGLSFLMPRADIDYTSPFVAAFISHNVDSLKWIAAIGTLLATGATKIASMYVVPRMFYRMSADGLIFKWIGHVNECSQVPVFALFLGGILSSLIALVLDIKVLADFTSLGILFAYCIIGLNLIILRYLLETPVDAMDEEKSDQTDLVLNIRSCFGLLCFQKSFWRRKQVFLGILTVHIISVVAMSLTIDYSLEQKTTWIWCLFGITTASVFVTFGFLCIYKPNKIKDSFSAPLMPLAPALTIIINMLLILRLPTVTWLRFVVWSAIGFIIYFGYGVRHSNVHNVNTEDYQLLTNQDNISEEIEIAMNDEK